MKFVLLLLLIRIRSTRAFRTSTTARFPSIATMPINGLHHRRRKISFVTPPYQRTVYQQTIRRVSPRSTASSLYIAATPSFDFFPSSLPNANNNNLWDSLLASPTFWSVTLMLTLVFLLYVWEEAVKLTKESIPLQLRPVVDSMLGEMGGLGFIGLVLGITVTNGPLGTVLNDWSEHYLSGGGGSNNNEGEEANILLETFEFLHTAFFEVGIAFFVISGLIVWRVLQQVQALDKVTRTAVVTQNDGKIVAVVDCMATLANALGVEADQLVVDYLKNDVDCTSTDNINSIVRQSPRRETPPLSWFVSQEDIFAECLVVRERIMQTNNLSPTFKVENYFANLLGERLVEMVELSPLTWLPLIPALSLGRTVDMTHHVVSASAPNAVESCGYFLGTTPFAVSTTFAAILGALWGGWNYYKMARIKDMVVPTLVLTPNNAASSAVLLPPRMEDPDEVASFNSSPAIVGWIESFFAKHPTNTHETLFGVAGAAGPELYLQSIKIHTWLVTGQIVFWGGQIVTRDVVALASGHQVADIGRPELLVPELLWSGSLVALALLQLLLAPQTFLNYNLITSVEQFIRPELLQQSCCEKGILEEMEGSEVLEEMEGSKTEDFRVN